MDVHKIYTQGYNWLLTHGPKIVFGIIFYLIGLWFVGILKKWMRGHMNRKSIHSSLQPFFLSLAITALHVVIAIAALQIMGFELTFFTAIISAATVAIGLALSGTFQNFAGGIMILLLRPFELGENIIAQGQDGTVTSIQIFYTVILTFDNKTVIIPNGKLFNEVIVNVSREGSRRLDVEIKLGFGVDIDQVKTTIDKSINEAQNILAEPARFIGIKLIEADGIRFTARVWVKPEHFLASKLDLQERILKDLKNAGVKLPGT